MKIHLRYAPTCHDCEYDNKMKPLKISVMFSCDFCKMSFVSDYALDIHLKTHSENWQNNDGL